MPHKPAILESRQVIERAHPEVFHFFAAPENLQAITPPWLHFRILTPGPIRMEQGAIFDYAIRIRGVPIRWRTRITDYRPPHRFVDSQIRGPYSMWEHTHTFEAVRLSGGREGTAIVDVVRYRATDVPEWMPVIGGCVQRWIVRPELDRIFAYRTQQISRIFSTSARP